MIINKIYTDKQININENEVSEMDFLESALILIPSLTGMAAAYGKRAAEFSGRKLGISQETKKYKLRLFLGQGAIQRRGSANLFAENHGEILYGIETNLGGDGLDRQAGRR